MNFNSKLHVPNTWQRQSSANIQTPNPKVFENKSHCWFLNTRQTAFAWSPRSPTFSFSEKPFLRNICVKGRSKKNTQQCHSSTLFFLYLPLTHFTHQFKGKTFDCVDYTYDGRFQGSSTVLVTLNVIKLGAYIWEI